jgi:hypothetical protein
VHGPDIGLVPVGEGGGVQRWRGSAAAPPQYLPDVATAHSLLRAAIRDAAERLAELDVAAWGPDLADGLMNLRTGHRFDAPVWFASPRASEAAASAMRILSVASAAARVDTGPITAAQAAARAEALRPLSAAARQALVAACSEGVDR